MGDERLALRLLPVLDAAEGFCIADVCYWYGPVAHHQGILRAVTGELEWSLHHLADAIALERRLDARPWLARSLAEMARVRCCRSADGDAAAAEAAAAEARELATDLGLAAIPGLLAEPFPVAR